jgi:hypothetical protein
MWKDPAAQIVIQYGRLRSRGMEGNMAMKPVRAEGSRNSVGGNEVGNALKDFAKAMIIPANSGNTKIPFFSETMSQQHGQHPLRAGDSNLHLHA